MVSEGREKELGEEGREDRCWLRRRAREAHSGKKGDNAILPEEDDHGI